MPEHDRSRPSMIVSLTAIALALVAIAATIPPIARAVFGPSAEIESLDAELERQVVAHAEAQKEYMARFVGRSAFYMPKIALPRPEPRERVQPPEPRERLPDPEPPRPRQYSGPGIKAFDGQKVWFADGKLLGVGEEASGLKVLEVNAPWSARVAYLGWEGDVQIFPTFDPTRVFRNALGERTPGIRESDASPRPDRASVAPSSQSTPPAKRDPEIPDE